MADLFHRVSIRKYQDRPVEREKIVEILRAAMAAPSAKNQQPWEFYVITKKDTLEKLSKASPYAGMTANAPVAIISAYRKDCRIPTPCRRLRYSCTTYGLCPEADYYISRNGPEHNAYPSRG